MSCVSSDVGCAKPSLANFCGPSLASRPQLKLGGVRVTADKGGVAVAALPCLPLSRRLEEGGVVEEEEASDSAALRCSSEASRDEHVAMWARTHWSSDLGGHPGDEDEDGDREEAERRRDGVLGG